MDIKLQEFESLWTSRFPSHRLPDLSFLIDNPLNLNTIADVLKTYDEGETQTARKCTLREQLKEVQYCLSYILGIHSTVDGVKGEENNLDSSQSLFDSDRKQKVRHENWKASSASNYDTLPSRRPKVIHSEKFIDTMTKVCKLIPPNQGRTLLESIGVTCNGSIDLSEMLLDNEMIDESDLSPFFKALEDNQLAHLITFFDKFKKKENTKGEEANHSDHYMEMKPIEPSEVEPLPLPCSPRPEMSTRKFFSQEPTERESPYYLAQDFSKGQAKGSRSLDRRGSLDITKLGSNRRTLPRRGRLESTGSLESIRPMQLLSLVRSMPKLTRSSSQTVPGFVTHPKRLFIERDAASDSDEGGSRSHSPLTSPMSPMGPRNGLQFVIRLIEDCNPLDRTDGGFTELEGYERLLLFKGERLDVISLWSDEYVARNLKGEIGLVPKDKCEILTGVSPVLWEREWFFKCSRRHSVSDLLKNEPVGTFFIRECNSKPGDFVLSVKMIHLTAKFQINVKLSRYEVSTHLFTSLDTLISHYKDNAIYIDNGEEVFLTKPLQHGRCT